MAESRHQHSPLIPDDRLLDYASASDLAERFKLLSDPHRLRIIYALVEGGEMCVGAIAELVGSSESATSHQLRNLRLAGFVRSRRHGREVFYSVADSHIRVLLDVAVEHYLHNHEDRP
jgi:DNA-binding transcriptional ArsR family regulator